MPEHRIIESKPDTPVEDLRIANPFPALRAYVDAIDLAALDEKTHSEVPYVALLLKTLDRWRAQHGGAMPRTTAEKEDFRNGIRESAAGSPAGKEPNYDEAVANAYRAYTVFGVEPEVREVLDDAAASGAHLGPASEPFWFVASALRDFVAAEGALPVSGVVPDMHASTDMYIALQKLYHTKAAEDTAAVLKRVQDVAATAGAPANHVPESLVELMCKNARHLRLMRFRPLAQELDPATLRKEYASLCVFLC